jgi:hypothetical protein
MTDPQEVPADVHQALAALAEPRPMRRGSLSERYMKCNKPGCPCGERPEARHGPYYSLTRIVRGITRSRLLSSEQATLARAQVEAGRQFREQAEAYWGACERWADAQLDTPKATSQGEVAKKGGSRKRSTRKSLRRLRRS